MGICLKDHREEPVWCGAAFHTVRTWLATVESEANDYFNTVDRMRAKRATGGLTTIADQVQIDEFVITEVL